MAQGSTDRGVISATLVAAAMIAQQVGGKAVRDAFFLSEFDVASLPTMMVVSALLSIVVVRGVMGRAASTLVTWGFAGSGLLLVGEWALSFFQPRMAAVALYLHLAVFGSVLISGFWSLITDRFDPHTARKRMGQIATGASAGAVVGGLLVERVGAVFSVTAAFPVLAALHLICAALILPLRTPPRGDTSKRAASETGIRAGMEVMKRLPYLRNLAYLVFVGAAGAALIDYAFKAEVASSLSQGESMMRFFALYYTGIGVTTLVVQGTLSQRALEKLGLAGTAATLPATVVLGSVGMLAVPGLGSALVTRGAESTFRSSLFRSGYELFYSPVAPRDKRATKTAIDVLWERLGDVAGGLTAKGLLLLGPFVARSVILAVAAATGGIALWLCHRLHSGYVGALEARLLDKAKQGPAAGGGRSSVPDASQLQSVLLSVTGGLSGIIEPGTLASPAAVHDDEAPLLDETYSIDDEVHQAFLDLRSSDPARVRRVLDRQPLEPSLVPYVIPLLARDDLAHAALRALTPLAERVAGQLGDVLCDAETDLALRRRIPSVLARGAERSAASLTASLGDPKFAVRYRCGRALNRLQSNDVPITLRANEVFELVRAELEASRRVLEGDHRLADPQGSHEEQEAEFNRLANKRAEKRMAHIFHLLALTLPPKPLKMAFRGLESDDQHLRGTSLEYLDSVLPPEIREPLWPFLTKEPVKDLPRRPREEIVEDLLKSSMYLEVKADPDG